MSGSQFDRVADLFERCLEVPDTDREALLASEKDVAVVAEVKELLRHRAGAALGESAAGWKVDGSDLTESFPRQFGGYELRSVIGRGAQGTVYEALQASPARPVALKVLNAAAPFSSAHQRFEDEAAILARLQHPGIAAVYAVGAAVEPGGTRRPFIAMELVRGRPLLEHARELGLRERLALLEKICAAVHHAHQKAVVHRDLKPGNILVDESGQPKVLDFGIARLRQDEARNLTVTGQVFGTLAYMSPEQVSGRVRDIDTQSDVYALGVIACELLTGELPYDIAGRMVPEIARIIAEQPPLRPGDLDRALRGDVETIVLKALEKESGRRYQSAREMGEDLRRYLDNQPITARPTTVFYQLSKLARRHRGLFAGIATACVVLVVAVILTSLALARALHAEREARLATGSERRQRLLAEQTLEFWSTIMNQASRRYGSSAATIREALELAASQVKEQLDEDEDAARAARHHVIGQSFFLLEDYTRALPLFHDAVRLYETSLGPDHVLTRTAAWDEAMCRCALEQPGALVELQSSLERLLEVSKPEQRENWERMAPLAALLGAAGQREDANRWLDRLEAARANAGDSDSSRYAAQTLMARAQIAETPDESIRRLREAKDILARIYGDNHIETVEPWRLLCFRLSYAHREAEAVVEYESLLPAARAVYADPNLTLADTIKEYAACQIVLGRAGEADALAMEAIAMYRKLGRQCDQVRTADLLNGLHHMHAVQGNAARTEEVAALRRQLIEECRGSR